eukprot:11888516-Alexandrium_andersonii.AAC.1
MAQSAAGLPNLIVAWEGRRARDGQRVLATGQFSSGHRRLTTADPVFRGCAETPLHEGAANED